MFVSSACMEAHTHTYSHTLTILGQGPDPQCPRKALDRVYKSALYTLHTHTLRVSALSVCVCGGGGCVPLKALFLVSIISNTEINIYFKCTNLKGGLPYNTDCFSYWQGTIQASYAVMRQLLFLFSSNVPV